MKACSKCGETKALTGFYKRPGGHFGDCKTCVLASRRKRYEQDGDILRARVKAYQDMHPDERSTKQRARREAAVVSATARARRTYLKRYGLTPAAADYVMRSRDLQSTA